MSKYYDTLTTTSGDVLVNHRVQVLDSAGVIVQIDADNSGTRFTDSTGAIVNYATSDELGYYEFYWTPQAGHILQVLDAGGNLVRPPVTDFADNLLLDNLSGDIEQARVTGLTADLASKAEVSTYASLAALKAASATTLSYNLVGTSIDGIFNYETTNAPYTADDNLVIKLDNIDLSVGALVRQYDVVRPEYLGATKDGTNTATEFQAMINAASGRVHIPNGRYNLESTISIPEAILIEGLGSARPTIRGANTGDNQAILEHDHAGDMFSFTGSNDTPRNMGFGFKSISLVQTVSGVSVGSAIKVAPSADANAIAWVSITETNIEKQSSGLADWQWGLEFDGSATTLPSVGIRDIFLSDIRVVCGPNATGALLLSGCYNVFVQRFEANISNHLIRITGQTSNVFMSDTTVGEIEIDDASNVFCSNVSAATIQTTTNASRCIIYGSCSTLDLQGTDNWFIGFVGNEFTIANSDTSDMKMDLKSRLIVEKTIAATDYIMQIRNGAGFGAGIQFETDNGGSIEGLGRIYGVTRSGYTDTGLEFWTKLSDTMTRWLILTQEGTLLPNTDGSQDVGSSVAGFSRMFTNFLALDETPGSPSSVTGKSLLYMNGDNITVRKSNGTVLTYSPDP